MTYITLSLNNQLVEDGDRQMVLLWLQQFKASTRRVYTTVIQQFLGWIEHKSLAKVSTRDLEEFKVNLLSRYSPNTSRNKLSIVRSFFSYAQKCGYLAFNCGAAVKTGKEVSSLHERILTAEEVAKLIASVENKKYQIAVKLMFGLGLRVNECLTLKWGNVRGNKITVVGKGGRVRTLIIPQYLLEELEGIRSEFDYIFATKTGKCIDQPAVFRALRKAAKKSGVNANVSPHWLRHTSATLALNNGANVRLICESLGHSSLAITTKYLHLNPDDSHSLYLPKL